MRDGDMGIFGRAEWCTTHKFLVITARVKEKQILTANDSKAFWLAVLSLGRDRRPRICQQASSWLPTIVVHCLLHDYETEK